MLLLYHLGERSQRGGSATAAAWPVGQRVERLPAEAITVNITSPEDACVFTEQIKLHRTVSWIVLHIAYTISILAQRRLQHSDNDEHGTAISRTGCGHGTRRRTTRPSHGYGPSSKSWRTRRRTTTGCSDGAADASWSFGTWTSGQSSWTDDGQYTTRGWGAGTGRTRSRWTKCACPVTSQSGPSTTDVCATAGAAAAAAATYGACT